MPAAAECERVQGQQSLPGRGSARERGSAPHPRPRWKAAMSETTGWDAIVLHAADHVATALRKLARGERVRVNRGGEALELTLAEDIPLCHKVAIAALKTGAPIRKYGEVIGEATSPIAAGQHVHIHNLRSLRARKA